MRVLPCYAAPKEGAEIALEFPNALQLGVSSPVAATRLSLALAQAETRPDLVLLFGVAGAFPERHLADPAQALHPGEVVWVRSEVFADLGVQSPSGFLDLASLGLEAPGRLAMDAELSDRLARRTGHRQVDACTVATGAGTDPHSAAVAERSGALIESMEGAAVALACASFGVRMVQVRAISNYTGDRQHGAWDLDKACAAVQACVRNALQELEP